MPSTEGFFGWGNERTQITNTRQLPYRNIVDIQLARKKGSGKIDGGATGFFVSPRTIITTGHSLYDPARPRAPWYEIAFVVPAHNESAKTVAPYGVIEVEPRSMDVHPEWKKGNEHYDLGAIILDKPIDFGPRPQFFTAAGHGIQKRTGPPFDPKGFDDASGMKGMKVYSAGYPSDAQPDGTLWGQHATILEVARNLLVYDLKTTLGQSGAPVWAQPDTTMRPHPIVIAVNKAQHKLDPAKGLALRFDASLLDWLERQRAKGSVIVPAAEGAASMSTSSTSTAKKPRRKPAKRVKPAKAAKAKAAKPPEPPKEVEGAYVIKSESSDVVHVLHDCPGLQNARNPVDTRRAGSLHDVTPVLREMGRPLCALCLDRLTAEHREAVTTAVTEVASPDLTFRVEADFGVLTIDRDGVRVWARYADETTAFRLDQLTNMDAKGPTLFQAIPSIVLSYDGGGFFKKRVTFLFDDAGPRDAAFDQADAVITALLEVGSPTPYSSGT